MRSAVLPATLVLPAGAACDAPTCVADKGFGPASGEMLRADVGGAGASLVASR